MLQLSSNLIGQPVLSLRSGGLIAMTTEPIINPLNLKIEGLYCADSIDRKKVLILLEQDIREILAQGLVVNDHDVLAEPEDLVRLRNVLATRFTLIGKTVYTTSKHKIGKVIDFSTETKSMYIQKLYVGQSVFKSFTGGNLGIDRTQIVEITDDKIIVQDLEKRVPVAMRATA
jgi:sporulation protein YlmC with PRC-barrel domain